MVKRQKANLSLEIASVYWERVPGLKTRLKAAAAETLAFLPDSLALAAEKSEFVVLLTTDHRVHTLNRDYRGYDKVTNVLSFPSFEAKELPMVAKMEDELHVGDIAIAYRYSVAEARREKKVFLDHATHLMIHGILHLFGYDHITTAKARVMEKMEKDIMASLGLPNPYAVLHDD